MSGWAGGLFDHLRDGLRGYLDVLGDEPEAPGADMSGDRLDPPPPAEPYQPPAKDTAVPDPLVERANNGRREPTQTKPTPTTGSSGAPMSSDVSYDSLKARLMGISSNLTEIQGPLQQASQSIDEQTTELTGAAQGGGAGVQEALGNLQRAKQSIEEANQAVMAAQQSTESAAAQLAS